MIRGAWWSVRRFRGLGGSWLRGLVGGFVDVDGMGGGGGGGEG